jgi:ribose transport system permease protein
MNTPISRARPDSLQRSQRVYSRWETTIRLLLDHGLLVALVVEIVLFSVASPTIFFSRDNFFTILRMSAATGITVAFFTMALIARQIDLSTLQVGGVVAVAFGWMFGVAQWPLEVAFILAMLLAVAIGFLNAWLVTKVGIPSLVGTLAVGTLCFGLALAIVQATSTTGLIRLTRPPLRSIVSTEVFGIPATVIVMFIVYLFVYIVLNHTRLGAHLYALGGNPNAARLNGIRSTRLIYLVLVGTAVSASLAAIIAAGRSLSVGSMTQVGGTGTVLAGPFIGAVFGGVGLGGGTGKIERTLFAVLFLSVLTVGMSILNASPFIRIMVEGVAFVLAIALDSVRQRLDTR